MSNLFISILSIGGFLFFISLLIQFSWCKFITSFGREFFSDVPNQRSSHTTRTPRGGGFTFGVIISLAAATNLLLGFLTKSEAPLLLISFLLLPVIGLIDDKKSLRAKTRLFFHIATSFLIVFAMHFRLAQHFSFSTNETILFFCLFTLFGTAAINFYNFADGINGHIGLQSLLSCLLGLLFFVLSPLTHISLNFFSLSISLIAALFVFLRFNLFKKMLFMGDTGSTTLGLFQLYIGLIPFYFLEKNGIGTTHNVITSTSIFICFLYLIGISSVVFIDCGTMVIAKMFLRFPLSQPHREHIYQRLSRKNNIGHKSVAVFLLVLQLLLSTIFTASLYLFKNTKDLISFQIIMIFLCSAFAFRSNYLALKKLHTKS